MGFLTPDWMSTNESLAMRSVLKLSLDGKQNQLEKVANQAPLEKIRLAAIDRLKDENVLYDLAQHHTDAAARCAATGKIQDEDYLAQIAKTDNNVGVCEKAVRRIKDTGKLFSIAQSTSMKSVGEIAVGKISKKDQLISLASWCQCDDVAGYAMQRINEPTTLKNIAVTSSAMGIQLKAVEQLVTQSLLQQVALEVSNNAVKLAAYRKLEHSNPDICRCVYSLESINDSRDGDTALNERNKAAVELAKLLPTDKLAASIFWKTLATCIAKRHEDTVTTITSSCDTVSNIHHDNGGLSARIVLPPYPFKG